MVRFQSNATQIVYVHSKSIVCVVWVQCASISIRTLQRQPLLKRVYSIWAHNLVLRWRCPSMRFVNTFTRNLIQIWMSWTDMVGVCARQCVCLPVAPARCFTHVNQCHQPMSIALLHTIHPVLFFFFFHIFVWRNLNHEFYCQRASDTFYRSVYCAVADWR